ncbi:MAG TPA: hypothetical protein VFM93_12740, partial [Candidatus Limnocylindria bacterium]|nr:hypothetical protein [Candidatus Limnocylindria bacterium]
AASYCARAADALRGAACGALLWCYADYDRSLWGEAPFDLATHERHFGLWRADGRAKPAVAALAAVTRERAPAGDDLGWIDVAREDYYRDPAGNLRRLYAAYTASSLS